MYYNARKISGDINEDIGAYISTAIEAVKTYGLCREDLWPYDPNKFDVEPGYICYRDARKRTIDKVYEIVSHEEIVDMLDRQHPVVVGVAVYSDFDRINNQSTILKMPGATEEPIDRKSVV